jgi:chromosome partitioning protein
MRTLAIVNQKGGSGKTTTCVNLAAALAERGRKVLVVDLDGQCCCSTWFGIRDESRGLMDVLEGKRGLAELVIALPDVAGVSLVPGTGWLTTADQQVSSKTILKRALASLPASWDYVLLDCPPALGILTVNALAAAGECVAAVEASLMAVDGLARLLETVRGVREQLNPELVLRVLPCRVDARTRHAVEVLELLRQRYPGQVLRASIRENVALAEAYAFAQPITTYAPHANGSEDYQRLAAEVIRQERRT